MNNNLFVPSGSNAEPKEMLNNIIKEKSVDNLPLRCIKLNEDEGLNLILFDRPTFFSENVKIIGFEVDGLIYFPASLSDVVSGSAIGTLTFDYTGEESVVTKIYYID